MRRREVIGSLAALLPFSICSARARVSHRPSLIAILSTGSDADVGWGRLRGSFQRGLQDLGYAEGRHYVLEERFTARRSLQPRRRRIIS